MPALPVPLRVGTRDSRLAIKQAAIVQSALIAMDPTLSQPGRLQIVPMSSAGDWRPGEPERSFLALGGNKGLFAKELECALLDRRIDLAVHSAKDIETVLAEGLILAGFIARDDVRDAFVSAQANHPDQLPQGARVGTASLRRAVQLLNRRPDLIISPLRGNVETRLRKVRDGQVDATLLACCGLLRLGITAPDIHPLPVHDMLPAVAQGALAIEIRDEPSALRDLVRSINCPVTERCVTLERLFLQHLNGSCRTPVAALALPDGGTGRIHFTALVAQPDGAGLVRRQDWYAENSAAHSVAALGEELRAVFPSTLLA